MKAKYVGSYSSVMGKIMLTGTVLSMFIGGAFAYKDELVVTQSVGFRMKSVVQDVGTQQIVAKFVISGGNNVVPILYMPKVNSPEAYLDVASNPCASIERDKLCCLKSMNGMYDMDVSWVQRLSLAVMEACNSTDIPFSAVNNEAFSGGTFPGTLGISTILQGGNLIPIPGVVYTYESVMSDDNVNYENMITLRMATTYVVPLSKVLDLGLGTYKYEFFVGVVFATLLEKSTDILTTVVQQRIEFTKSDFGFFAVGTEQDRSIIKQVATFIHEAKNPPEMDGDEIVIGTGGEKYQYVEVNIDFDSLYTQGTKSVKVMMDTLKFAQSATSPVLITDWTFPCSPVESSFYQQNVADWTNLFAKNCLPERPTFCSETFTNKRFFIPFDTTTATATNGYVHGINRGETLFVAFEIIFSDSVGNSELVETVYATVNVNNFPVLEHCADAVVVYHDITETVQVAVTLGTASRS